MNGLGDLIAGCLGLTVALVIILITGVVGTGISWWVGRECYELVFQAVAL